MIKSVTNFLLSNVSEQRIRLLIFSVGFTLTIWRSCECFQKYLHSNLSVRIDMVKNTDTFAPSLTICPEYFISYTLCKLNWTTFWCLWAASKFFLNWIKPFEQQFEQLEEWWGVCFQAKNAKNDDFRETNSYCFSAAVMTA